VHKCFGTAPHVPTGMSAAELLMSLHLKIAFAYLTGERVGPQKQPDWIGLLDNYIDTKCYALCIYYLYCKDCVLKDYRV
jgi:hypothetical protein